MKRVGDGNTILCDMSTKALNGGIDTVYYYYTFKDRQIQSIRLYRRDQVDNMPFGELKTYMYDGQGNLKFVDNESGGQKIRYTISGTDGKKNPYRLMPPSTFIYLASHTFYVAGNDNPVKAEAPGVRPTEYSYTYNDAGYPLNMKIGTGYDVSYEYTKRQ